MLFCEGLSIFGIKLHDQLDQDDDDHSEHEDTHQHDTPPEDREASGLFEFSLFILFSTMKRGEYGLLFQLEIDTFLGLHKIFILQ